jgi:hypothetical protein
MPSFISAIEFSDLDIAGHAFKASQVEVVFYLILGLIALLLIFLLVKLPNREKTAPPEPKYEEVFDIESEVFETNPYKNDPDTYFEQNILRTVTLTLIVGLREHLTKMAENDSDQHKAMAAIAKHLETQGAAPIAFTQWNQSPIQGIAARIILSGKSRTALFGPSIAMAKASAPFTSDISSAVASGHSAGHSVFVLAIDGLAYAEFSVSHRLQLVTTM